MQKEKYLGLELPDLFYPDAPGWKRDVQKANTRKEDPWTSHAAAKSISSEKLGEQQMAIIDVLSDVGRPLAAEDIDNILGWAGFRRMSELKRMELIEDSGKTFIGRSGRQAIKYQLTAKGASRG